MVKYYHQIIQEDSTYNTYVVSFVASYCTIISKAIHGKHLYLSCILFFFIRLSDISFIILLITNPFFQYNINVCQYLIFFFQLYLYNKKD